MDLRRKSDSICLTPPRVMPRLFLMVAHQSQTRSRISCNLTFKSFLAHNFKSNLSCSAKTCDKEFWPRLTNECQIGSEVDQGQANMGFHQYLPFHKFHPSKAGKIIFLCIHEYLHKPSCAIAIFAVLEHGNISEYRSSFR